MTSQEMMKAHCPKGYWFLNVAGLGETPDWQIQIEPRAEQLNDFTLFSYDKDVFLAKQYHKRAAA